MNINEDTSNTETFLLADKAIALLKAAETRLLDSLKERPLTADELKELDMVYDVLKLVTRAYSELKREES